MVRGIESFREWFSGYEENYVVIGGTACDLLMGEAGEAFRATRDIDMVLIVENLNADFGIRFWEYVKAAGYEQRQRNTGTTEYFRFLKPQSAEYPFMIELLSRRIDSIVLPPDAVLTPIPINDEISSLSAILLNDDYYDFLRTGVTLLEGIPVLGVTHLIPFKAKAWLDLTERKAQGHPVQSGDIRKHKNDVLRLSMLLSANLVVTLPDGLVTDMHKFLADVEESEKYSRVATAYGL